MTEFQLIMGADLCSTLGATNAAPRRPCCMEWVRDVGPSRNGGSGVLPPENLGNFICQTVHFGEYLYDN